MYVLNRRKFLEISAAGSVMALTSSQSLAAKASAEVFTADPMGAMVDSTVVVGQEKALLIDAQFTKANAERLADVIAATGKNLETIYITHYHPDHHLGLAVLSERFPGARAVAHATVQPKIAAAAQPMLDDMRSRQPEAFADRVVIPEILAGDHLELEGERFDILGPLHGDTEVSTAVHLGALDTIVAADLVYNGTHLWLAENTTPEDIDKWRGSLNSLEEIGAGTIIPGHRSTDAANDVSGFEHMRNYLNHWEASLATASNAADLKASMIERVGNLPGEFFLDRAAAAAFS